MATESTPVAAITTGAPPYHAYLEKPDGSWYMVWMTRTFPKTSRGHPWHVHMRWNNWGGPKPWRGWRWWERPWGTANRDFHDPNEAVNEFFFNRYLPRLEHGYRVISGHLAPGWPVAPAPDSQAGEMPLQSAA